MRPLQPSQLLIPGCEIGRIAAYTQLARIVGFQHVFYVFASPLQAGGREPQLSAYAKDASPNGFFERRVDLGAKSIPPIRKLDLRESANKASILIGFARMCGL